MTETQVTSSIAQLNELFVALSDDERRLFLTQHHLQYDSSSSSDDEQNAAPDAKSQSKQERMQRRSDLAAARAQRRQDNGKQPRENRKKNRKQQEEAPPQQQQQQQAVAVSAQQEGNNNTVNGGAVAVAAGSSPRRYQVRGNRSHEAIRLVHDDNTICAAWPGAPLHVSSTLPRTDADLKVWFEKLDVDGSGAIEKHEFKKLYESMEHFGAPVRSKRLEEKMKAMTKVDGKLTYDEFVVLVMEFVKA